MQLNILLDVKMGDTVKRFFGGLPMELIVTEVTPEKIICGSWTFDRATGAEIDQELGWGPPPLYTGSYIIREATDDHADRAD